MPSSTQVPSKNLHHFSFRTAFMSGLYEADFTLRDLLAKGDFGLGTFNHLDGEMIVLDGEIYRGKTNGTAEMVTDLDQYTPSATVTFFVSDTTTAIENLSVEQLHDWIKEHLDTERQLYAIKVKGTFAHVKSRSQTPTVEQPFPPIEDILDKMVYHNLERITGTLVGFQLPPYVQGINYPGLHFHFVGNKTHQFFGGCAPDFFLQSGTIEVMQMNSFSVDIPSGELYDQLQMNPEKADKM